MSSGSPASTFVSSHLDAVESGLEPVAEMRADVHDHGLGVERRRDVAAGRERDARLLDDGLVGAARG